MARRIGRGGAAALSAMATAWAGAATAQDQAETYASVADAAYVAAYAVQDEWADAGGGWDFAITPYVYLPSISGDLRFDTPPGTGNQPRVRLDAEDILENLDLAFMVAAEARKGRWFVLTDVMYVDLSADQSQVRELTGPGGRIQVPIDVGTSTDVTSWVWSLGVGAQLGRPGGRATMEAFAGFRYLTVDADLNWSFSGPLDQFPQSGSFSQEEDVWDGIAGVRGRVAIDRDRRWNVTYYVDVGAGDSDLTWQAILGLAYDYSWGDVRLAWRTLDYSQSADKFVNDMQLSGPALGATFRF